MKLTAKHIKSTDRLVISPSWVSTGVWAMKREFVENSGLLETDEAVEMIFKPRQIKRMSDAQIEQIVPSATTETYRWTPLVQNHGKAFMRIWRSDNGEYVATNEDYNKVLEFTENSVLYGSGGILCNEEKTKLLCIVKLLPTTTEHLKATTKETPQA